MADPFGLWGDWNTDAARSAIDDISGTWGRAQKMAPYSQSSQINGQDIWRLGAGDWTQPGSYMGLTPQYDENAGYYVPFADHARVSNYNPDSMDAFGTWGLPLMAAGLGAIGPLAGAAAGAGAGELMGPSALELGVPGATGYAAPYEAGFLGGAASGVSGAAGGGSVGATELMGPSALELGVPGATGYAAPYTSTGGALGAATQAANGFKIPGTDTTIPNNVLAGGLQGLLGYLGSNAQSDSLKDIYNQTRADRSQALGAYNNALANPDTFYNSAPAMGATDAVLRRLSVNGNPALNPGDISKAAAYNLGGYNDYLRGLTPAAFGTASTEANLGASIAGADSGQYNAIGYGLGTALNPQPSIQDILKQIGGLNLNIGGTRLA